MDVKNDTGSDYCSSSERLYLHREDNKEVYVDCPLLRQHQIDALRFLYKTFHKKCPGAVINFPSSCGKSTVVALYLKAVSHLLKEPVLILCKDEAEIQYWKGTLLKWLSFVEDAIAVESLNPFIKGKRVFLNTRENLASHLRRRWSVAVAKENVDMCKLKFETDFKIYITSVDIKKDLSLLSTVYTWLYPKRKHNILNFTTKDKCPKERFRKSIQLDVILEDVIIKRFINLKPFERTEVTSPTTNIAQVETKRVKNKDATGTKIKRSKKVTTPATTPPPRDVLANDQISKESGENVHLMNELSHKNMITNDKIENVQNQSENNVSDRSIRNNSPMDSESFISDQKKLNNQGDFNELSCLNNNEKSKTKYKFYESLHIDADSQVDGNEVEIKDLNKNELLRKCLLQSLGNNKENNSKINRQRNDKNQGNTKSLRYDNYYSNIDLRGRKYLNKNMLQKQAIESFKSSVSDEDVKIELKNEINEHDTKLELKNELNENDIKFELKNELNENDIKLELKNEINHGNENSESILNIEKSDGFQSYSVNTVKELKANENIKAEPSDKKMKVEQDVNTTDKRKSDDSDKDLDDKISLVEEKAFKKFKGSLLDSIF